jgi:hypothetical protein
VADRWQLKVSSSPESRFSLSLGDGQASYSGSLEAWSSAGPQAVRARVVMSGDHRITQPGPLFSKAFASSRTGKATRPQMGGGVTGESPCPESGP